MPTTPTDHSHAAHSARDAAAKPARNSSAKRSYRFDLDGLRGLAIALVVVYHVWALGVSGGVDVFLTLSGFFFVGMLLRNIRRGTDLSPWPVAKRLIRRLLPALVTILTAVSIATVVLFPFTQWNNIATQVVPSLFYYQNWQLARTTGDYLAADPNTSPLQHLWSMSVQGQFFVATLLAVYFAAWATQSVLRNRKDAAAWSTRAAIAVIVGATIASFLYAALRIQINPSWTYYDTFARTWQLLLGGVVAAALPYISVHRHLRLPLAATGLAAIVLTGVVLEGGLVFPGPWALVPVLGALAIVVAGERNDSDTRGNLVESFLSTRPLVWLGSVAYAFYLWHWPILIFYLVAADKHVVTLLDGVGIIAISLLCAWLTLRYIEIPLRYSTRNPAPLSARRTHRRRTTYPAIALATLAAVLVTASVGWIQYLDKRTDKLAEPLDPTLYPGATEYTAAAYTPRAPLRPSPLDVREDHPLTAFDQCIADIPTIELLRCTYGDTEADRTIVLAGGSHAEQWISALHPIGIERGFAVETILKVACPLSLDPEPTHYNGVPYLECSDWNAASINYIIETQPDFVLTNSTRPLHHAPGDFIPESYADMFVYLAGNDVRVLGLRDNPWLWPFPEPADCLAMRRGADRCGAVRADVLSAVNPADAIADELPTMESLDMSDAMCNATTCPAVVGNVIVYRDFNHLSATFVRTAIPELDRQLGDATGWW
ncbi:acyltransferase [Hoyosella rhizosphaerae]|uniref:Acyltransferase n=1 Tax=Hoyosella rhizosphaerae TaxID=1755582 RepID=A0A916UFG3_9ACTN|nr:acyltransferase family protein [Hoyosella rhizosphaerae]MBN4927891.1 acyltransferase [Hoyosella rhizosphaerae]GGC70782.1 acyltransferase [Hoyosella rhizosphaerae]